MRALLNAGLGSALTLVVTLTAGCGGADVPPPSGAATRPAPAQAIPEAPVFGGLNAGNRPEPPAPDVQRNPFRFERGRAGGDVPAEMRDPPAGETLPELPLPIQQPALRLLGIATEGDQTTRIAVISVGDDLALAKVGDRLADRFEVTAIHDDAVELRDAVGGQPMRLALP